MGAGVKWFLGQGVEPGLAGGEALRRFRDQFAEDRTGFGGQRGGGDQGDV